MAPSNQERLEALTQSANELVAEVNTLNEGTGRKVEDVQKKVRRNQLILWFALASFIADIALTAILTLTINNVSNLTDRVNFSQRTQRARVLCPLYKIFVDSRSEQGRQAYAKGPEAYDKVFDIIEDSYRVLNCEHVDQPISR